MADTRQHRQRELRHVGAEPVGIEAVEVAGRTAAADDDHGVDSSMRSATAHSAATIDSSAAAPCMNASKSVRRNR